MQNKQEVADAIFKSIDVIVNKKLEKLTFDTTIIGQVTGIDSKRGYSINYRNKIIYAQPLGNITYQSGDIVYILVPNNDSNLTKFILGKISAEQLPEATQYHLRRENAVLKETLQLQIGRHV